VAESLAALRWLQAQGARQVYFKYCSTFDSTAQGNIGPVTEALMDALGADFSLSSPAFPENKRVVFKGYLYVGDVLLNESSMRDHPLTPMTDANLVRVLQAQTRRRVGLLDYRVIAQGAEAIERHLAALRSAGVAIAIVDIIADDDFRRIAPLMRSLPLVTGGSGMAIALPGTWGFESNPRASALAPALGHAAIISGSCSQATRGQVTEFVRRGGQALFLDPIAAADGKNVVEGAAAWAQDRLAKGPVLIYTTAVPEAVSAVQSQMGVDVAGALVERMLADVARRLVPLGVRKLIVAGGETSSAVLQALGVERLRIGPQIDPGVPWCTAHSQAAGEPMHLALKSGNFGAPDFFAKALGMLEGAQSPQAAHG
ncbi:MAG TPA: 3-oxo-tetronate kinase, partial [Usitatibacter sp.]|nr:3-oxo-tetronate kinase [Usitatibacter sp.]